MSVLYADTSALVRAYFADEAEHDELRRMLLEGTEPVVTSEIARVELASAAHAAARAKRIPDLATILSRFDADCGPTGPICLMRLRPEVILPVAHGLVTTHHLRTLDAIHLAVALQDTASEGGDAVVFVTRDCDQAKAASAHNLLLR